MVGTIRAWRTGKTSMRMPAPVVPVNNKKYTAEEINLEDGRTLYINRASGYKWQLRLNVRPKNQRF